MSFPVREFRTEQYLNLRILEALFHELRGYGVASKIVEVEHLEGVGYEVRLVFEGCQFREYRQERLGAALYDLACATLGDEKSYGLVQGAYVLGFSPVSPPEQQLQFSDTWAGQR